MRRPRLKRNSDERFQELTEQSESSAEKSDIVIARPVFIGTSNTMKKLSRQQQHRKQLPRCTNLVHIKQVERTDAASGSLIRTYQKHDRSSESLLRSSESVEEPASSNLSNECMAAASSRVPDDKKAIRASFSSDAQKEAVQMQSESSLTLSLPRDITTSWLEREREFFKESDSDVKTISLHRPSLAEPGSRTTAKSIFSTNKSLVLENTRNSIQVTPDAPASDVLSRPPEFPADVTPETSDFDDIHQFESLDASCHSLSDKEFKSVPSKVGGTRDADLVHGTDDTQQVFSPEQSKAVSTTSITMIIRQPPSEEHTVSEPTKECSCQHPVILSLGTTLGPTSAVLDDPLPRSGENLCVKSTGVTKDVVADVTSQDTLGPRKSRSQDLLPVSPSTSAPVQNLVTIEALADVLAGVQGNISSQPAQDDPRSALKTFDRHSVLESHVPCGEAPLDSSADEDRSTAVPVQLLDNLDPFCKALKMPVRDVGTTMTEAVALQNDPPKSVHTLEKLGDAHTLSSISELSVENIRDDDRKCIRSTCPSRVSKEDITTWICPEDFLFNDAGAVAGVPDFMYFEVDPTHGFPRRSSVVIEDTTTCEQSTPGILSAALRAQYSQGEQAEQATALSSDTNYSSFSTVPTLLQTELQAAKQNHFSGTSNTFKTTEDKSLSDYVLPHTGSDNGATLIEVKAPELESQLNDFSVEFRVEEAFRIERILTESDSRGFQPSFATEVCHRDKELSSVTETSASTLEEERADGDASIKHSGNFSLSKEGSLASSRTLSSRVLEQDEFPPVFSFSAEEEFATASAARTKDEGSAEDDTLLSDLPESLAECVSSTSREPSEQKVNRESEEQDITTVITHQREQRGHRRAFVAYWRQRRAAPDTDIFLGPYPSFPDPPPVVTTSLLPLYASADIMLGSPLGRLFGPQDIPTCAQDARANKEEDAAAEDSRRARGTATAIATELAGNAITLQDLHLERLVGKDELRMSPSRASGSVLEATCDTLDAAAPVIAISFAVLALVAAAAILLQREPPGPDL